MTKMEFKENAHDDNGIVLIPADTERMNIPSRVEVERFARNTQGGDWQARGEWHSTGDSDEVYMAVERR